MKVSELRCQICPASSADGPLYNTKSKQGWRCKTHLGDFQPDPSVMLCTEAIYRGSL